MKRFGTQRFSGWQSRTNGVPPKWDGAYNVLCARVFWPFEETLIMVIHRDLSPSGPEFRAELVARVRWEIQQGVYETRQKLELALERLFEEIGEPADEAY